MWKAIRTLAGGELAIREKYPRDREAANAKSRKKDAILRGTIGQRGGALIRPAPAHICMASSQSRNKRNGKTIDKVY